LERLLNMPFANPSDGELSELLASARVFAIVGASANPDRPSYGVMERLLAHGYHVIPVNPGHAGGSILGQGVYATIADVPAPVQVIDIFRSPDAALGVVDEAIAEKQRLGIKAIWMQLGVVNAIAAERAIAAGLTVVMDRCPKIELARLGLQPG
jgi:predicted CoA-binding protein